jgi:hypothetical protein
MMELYLLLKLSSSYIYVHMYLLKNTKCVSISPVNRDKEINHNFHRTLSNVTFQSGLVGDYQKCPDIFQWLLRRKSLQKQINVIFWNFCVIYYAWLEITSDNIKKFLWTEMQYQHFHVCHMAKEVLPTCQKHRATCISLFTQSESKVNLYKSTYL